ncbi:MAG TPA: hypothetical protein VLS25_06155 [Dehalococcoidia bacterium]|nr:hypothetical protein [Dehalococcoidia bacterium]
MGTRKQVWAGLLAVAAAAAVTLLVLGLAGAVPGFDLNGPGDGGSIELNGPGGGGTFDGSRLITSKRDRLAICVDVAGTTKAAPAALQTSAAASVNAVLDDLAANSRDWVADSLSSPTPVVDVGCPVGPALYDPNAGSTKGPGTAVIWGRTVSEASYYKAFVFVVPDADVQEATGGSRWRLTTEEQTCAGDVCTGVTVGVYLGEGEVSDIQLLRENLGLAVGVRQ